MLKLENQLWTAWKPSREDQSKYLSILFPPFLYAIPINRIFLRVEILLFWKKEKRKKGEEKKKMFASSVHRYPSPSLPSLQTHGRKPKTSRDPLDRSSFTKGENKFKMRSRTIPTVIYFRWNLLFHRFLFLLRFPFFLSLSFSFSLCHVLTHRTPRKQINTVSAG